jgi:hypothetical protein
MYVYGTIVIYLQYDLLQHAQKYILTQQVQSPWLVILGVLETLQFLQEAVTVFETVEQHDSGEVATIQCA